MGSEWRIGALVAVVAMTASAGEVPLPAGAREAASQIRRAVLEGPIRFLASDLLEGRAPSHRGDEVARTYLASELTTIGLAPGAPGGGWQQPFAIVGIRSQVPATWTFRTGRGSVDVGFGDEFIASSGVQAGEAAVTDAQLVFVGYGIRAPEFGWDDFKGVNVAGKVLLVMNDDPDWDPQIFAGAARTYYGRWTYKYEEAARQGAVGAIIIHTTASAGYGWAVVHNSWIGERFELPAGSEPRLAVEAWLTEAASRKLLKAAGFDLDALVNAARSREFRPVPLGVQTTLKFSNTLTHGKSGNVIGMVAGSDPVLRQEVVVFSAHHDHLGVGAPDATGDAIYNGAVDNASGVAEVLAIARAFAALPTPPRRSVVFAFVGGEESNLLGSTYFAEHPTVPAERVVADLNFDSANIFGRTRDVAQIGRGKSSLDDVLVAAAALQGRVVVPERFPERGAFYRSDHLSFAKIGVPSLYFSSGLDYIDRPPGWGKEVTEAWSNANYHHPSDQIDDSWNYDGMIEDAQLGFFVGVAVANSDAPPTWRPGDEFAHLRVGGPAPAGKVR